VPVFDQDDVGMHFAYDVDESVRGIGDEI